MLTSRSKFPESKHNPPILAAIFNSEANFGKPSCMYTDLILMYYVQYREIFYLYFITVDICFKVVVIWKKSHKWCTLSEAWSGVNWADLMAAQGAFGTNFYHRSTRTIVGTMLWTEYRPVIKIGPKGALGSHEIRPIHSAPSLGQSIVCRFTGIWGRYLPTCT